METFDNEIWKDIPGYNGYQASNLGRIRSHNKITYTERHGYRHWKDGQYKQISCTLISTLNNKEYTFRSLSQTSKFIGRSTDYIKRCKKENKPIISQSKEEYIIKRYN